MDAHELLLTALRASALYLILLVTIRLLGKRTVGNFTAFDLIVALMLGEVVDEPILGDVPLLQAVVAIVVIAGWHWVNSWLSVRSPRLDALTGGAPRVLVAAGTPVRAAMAREHVSDAELESMLRLAEVDDLHDVQRATLETNGHLSVIRTAAAKPLTRADLEQALQAARRQDSGS